MDVGEMDVGVWGSSLPKQESSPLMPLPSPGFGSASAGLSQEGKGELLPSGKMFRMIC
jgi:hypothetical protein